jgi:putative transposase
MLERLHEEIKRRTYVVRIFTNAESCLRLVRALAIETPENCIEASRYINIDDLREHNKLAMRKAALHRRGSRCAKQGMPDHRISGTGGLPKTKGVLGAAPAGQGCSAAALAGTLILSNPAQGAPDPGWYRPPSSGA